MSSADGSTNDFDTRSPRTAPTLTSAPKAHDGYRHEALLWQGHDEFLAGTLPFILEGVHAGQPVLAAVVPERVELLQRALGPDADRVGSPT